MNVALLRTGLIASALVIAIGAASAQQPSPIQKPETQAAPPTCSFSEIYNKDGWTVPGVDGAKVKQRAKFTNMPGVFVSILEPLETETNMTEVVCDRNHPGRLEIEDAPIVILALWSFDFGGKVFAYRISYGCEAMDHGKRDHLACSSTAFLYDVDGSGNFTQRDGGGVNGKGIGFMPSFIPDWAKGGDGETPNQ